MTPLSNIGEDSTHELNDLRQVLKDTNPFYARELESSSLLRPSKHEYPDTASKDTLKRAYRQMIRLRQMDNILQNAQRQGRISFYMTCTGEVSGTVAADNMDCKYLLAL